MCDAKLLLLFLIHMGRNPILLLVFLTPKVAICYFLTTQTSTYSLWMWNSVSSVYGGPLLIHVFFVKVLYLLGAMSLSMALQLDRHGLWNLLGPSLFALGIMAVAWVRATLIITAQ